MSPLDYAPTAYQIAEQSIESISDEWQALLDRAGISYPFLRPSWLRVWLHELGKPEDLLLLAIRDGNELAGVVPLLRHGDELWFAGDSDVCDYFDVISAPDTRAAILEALLEELVARPWQRLVFWGVREDSPTLTALRNLNGARGLECVIQEEAVCPRVALPPSWDEYLLTLTKKDRHELRRKIRRLGEAGETTIYSLSSRPEIAAAMPDFLRLHRISREDKAAFMTPDMERFFRSLCDELAAEDIVRLYFLDLDGRRVAAILAFDCDDELLLYNSGFDPAYSGVSVGLVSKALTLKQAVEDGKRCYDFLRGAEPYKYDLGAHDLHVFRCILTREGTTARE